MDAENAGIPVKQLLAASGITPSFAKRIQEADTDGNAILSIGEVYEIFRKEHQLESENKLFRRIIIALAVVLVLLVASLTGMTYGIVYLAKDTKVSPSNALVSTSTGQTLRTAAGALQLGNVLYNTSVSSSYVNSSIDVANKILRTAGTNAVATYGGDISSSAIINGCKLLLDGSRSFTAFEGTGSNTTVNSVNVSFADVATCQAFQSHSNVTGFYASVIYEGELYYIFCIDNSGTCQTFAVTRFAGNGSASAPSNTSGNSTAGRKLQSSSSADELLLLNFNENMLVGCHQSDGCNVLPRNGRKLQNEASDIGCGLAGIVPVVGGVAGFICNTAAKYAPPPSCFPGDATVITDTLGGTKKMSELRMGDKALSIRADGSPFFDEIYMFGHKDMMAKVPFVLLETDGGTSLRLTPDHHLHVQRPHSGTWSVIPASAAKIGDVVLTFRSGQSNNTDSHRIVSKSTIMNRGLFNPYTMHGSIVVDGVLASCHSSSALDGLFALLGVPLAEGYQFVFAPIRALYRILGPARMASVEFVIDAVAEAVNTAGTSWPSALLGHVAMIVAFVIAARNVGSKIAA